MRLFGVILSVVADSITSRAYTLSRTIMALEPAWLFLKATRTSAHPDGPIGSFGRWVAGKKRDQRFRVIQPNQWCENCEETIGPGEKCLCQRQIESSGTPGPSARKPNRTSSPGKVGGMQYDPTPDPYMDPPQTDAEIEQRAFAEADEPTIGERDKFWRRLGAL